MKSASTMRHTTRTYLLTPPGTGAIAVVRVSGPEANAVVADLFEPKTDHPWPAEASSRRVRYGTLVDDGVVLDDVVLSTIMEHGEPAVDIGSHGGIRIVENILGALDRRGAPIAHDDPNRCHWPVRNTIEREALIALEQARTLQAARFLCQQSEHLPGALAAALRLLSEDRAEGLKRLRSMMDGYRAARLLLDGASVALVGPPNVGKSTLFNRLLDREAAIVTDRPGTTRDWVEESTEMAGIPLVLVDTAGRRLISSDVEHEAIGRGAQKSREADLTVLVLDASIPLPSSDPLEEQRANTCLLVANKADLGRAWDNGDLHHATWGKVGTGEVIATSAKTGEGLDTLRSRILERLGASMDLGTCPTLFTESQAALVSEVLSDPEGRASTRLAHLLEPFTAP